MRLGRENPVFRTGHYESDYSSESSTYLGVTTKTVVLLGIISVMAMYTASTLELTSITNYIFTMFVAIIFSIVAVILTHRLPAISIITAPVYALCEGYILGVLSSLYAFAYGGEIVEYALMGTFSVFLIMLALYGTGIIRVGSFFRRFMFSVIGGILFANLAMFIASLLGVEIVNTGLYITVSIISTIAASFFLLIDFDRITRYIEAGAPKQSEWSLSLGIVTTIVWLYVELLRIIAIFARND